MFLKIGSGIETDCEENQAYPISQQRKTEKRMTLLSFMIDGVPRAIELEFIINRLLVSCEGHPTVSQIYFFKAP